MSRGLKGIVKFVLRIGISLGLMVWLVSRQEKAELAAAFRAMSPMAFAGAFFMYLTSQLVSAKRWEVISRSLGFRGNFVTYLKYYFVGMYFNLFLPTGVGGDLLKIIYLTQERPERLKASYTILMDRALGLGAMVGIGGIATFFLQAPLPHHFVLLLQGMGALVIFALALHRPIHHVIKAHIKTSPVASTVASLMRDPNTVTTAFILSIAVQGLGMGAISLLGHGMGLGLETGFYYSIFPLVALAILLPISFNGIGVREGGFIYFMGLRGIPQEKALALSLSFFGVQVISSLIGGVVYGLGLHRK